MANIKVNPRVDFVFKKLFGVDENKDLLIDLINSIVEEKDKVKDIIIKNPYNDKNFIGDKQSILDIKGLDALTGKWFNIEMQVSQQEFFNKRALYYWAKTYSGQFSTGELYSTLTKTISINFLNYTTIEKESNYHNVYKMYNVESKNEFIDDIEVHFIELDKFEEHSKLKSLLDKWTYFLKEYGKNKALPKELTELSAINKAIGVLENIQMNDTERELFESRINWTRDYESSIETAENMGRTIGENKARIEIVKNLLDILSDDIISEKTGTPLEEIAKIRANNK